MNKNKFITQAKAKKVEVKKNEMYTFIILADTPGYRMKSYGPTSLISFKDKKLIDIQIQSIANHFKNFEIILCCGFEIDKVYKHIRNNYDSVNIRLVENQLYNNSNVCESARLSLNNTTNSMVYILDGNLILTDELFADRINESYVYIQDNSYENFEVGININENNDIEYFSYGGIKPWSEIMFLHSKEMVDSFRKIVSNVEFKNKFIFEALNDLIKIKSNMRYLVNNNEPIIKVNNIKTYHTIKEKI